jgi:hypothetical protein
MVGKHLLIRQQMNISQVHQLQTTNANKEKFMLFGLLFLIGSLIISYPMIYAVRSDRKRA